MTKKPKFIPAEYFDPREYFDDEMKARGLTLNQMPVTIRNWYQSTDVMPPRVAWVIAVLWQMDAGGWLRLDAAWQERPRKETE